MKIVARGQRPYPRKTLEAYSTPDANTPLPALLETKVSLPELPLKPVPSGVSDKSIQGGGLLDRGVKWRLLGEEPQTKAAQVIADLLGVHPEMGMNVEEHDNARVSGNRLARSAQNLHVGAFHVDLDGVDWPVKVKFSQQRVETPRLHFDRSFFSLRFSGQQSMEAALFSQVKLRRSIHVAQRHFVEIDVAIFILRDALPDPAAIFRMRLEGQYTAFGSHQSRSQQREIALVASHIYKGCARSQELPECLVLRFFITAQRPLQHHSRFFDVEIDPSGLELKRVVEAGHHTGPDRIGLQQQRLARFSHRHFELRRLL